MICKWCGETLKTGDKTCRRCRREVPALSDCGGFYDLLPGAMPVKPQATYAAEQPSEAYSPEVQPIAPVLPDHAGQRSKRKNLILLVVALVAVVVAVGLLINTVVLNGKLNEANETIEELQNRVEKAEEQEEEEPKPGPSQNEDPTGEATEEATEETTEETTEDTTEETADPTIGGKEEEDNSSQQGNQKEDNVISLEINPEKPIVLTDAQAALLQSGPLWLNLKNEDGEVVISLYLVLDHEANELTIWMLEGMANFEKIDMTWKESYTGAVLPSEMIQSTIPPAGVPQLEWGEDEAETEPCEYQGRRLNIENSSINSPLEFQILCYNGGEVIVDITVSGVTLQ